MLSELQIQEILLKKISEQKLIEDDLFYNTINLTDQMLKDLNDEHYILNAEIELLNKILEM